MLSGKEGPSSSPSPPSSHQQGKSDLLSLIAIDLLSTHLNHTPFVQPLASEPINYCLLSSSTPSEHELLTRSHSCQPSQLVILQL